MRFVFHYSHLVHDMTYERQNVCYCVFVTKTGVVALERSSVLSIKVKRQSKNEFLFSHTSVWILDQETEQCVNFLTLIHLVVLELLCLDNCP